VARVDSARVWSINRSSSDPHRDTLAVFVFT